jgi:hypothetical protein
MVVVHAEALAGETYFVGPEQALHAAETGGRAADDFLDGSALQIASEPDTCMVL